MASLAPLLSRIHFGVFDLDVASGELQKSGIPIKLRRQAIEVLIMLTKRAGQVVTREEIRERLWSNDTFVDFERSINFCINQIRGALGDDPEKPRYVETLPRRGYRFIAPVTVEDTSAPTTRLTIVPSMDSEPTVKPQTWPAWIRPAMAAGAMVLMGGFAVVAWHLHVRKAHALTATDTVVLADFSNETSDSIFDHTLRQGLSVQLEQSPFLSMISDQQIQQTLKLMGQKPEIPLTTDLARELCQRAGSAAVLSGSIAQIGAHYTIVLKATSCASGELIGSSEAEAADKDHILAALGTATSQIRTRLGESLSSVEKLSTPLEQATTPSLEALQTYSLGWRAMTKGNYAAAVPLFQRAIDLDPNFAMAYAALGVAGGGREYTRRAYELRERVSERERFYIESHYYQTVTGDIEKARQVYELWAVTYPRDWVPLNQLGVLYEAFFGEYEKALEVYGKAIRIEPATSVTHTNIVATLIALNRLEDARVSAEEILTKDPDSPGLQAVLFGLDFLQNDTTDMAKRVAWAARKPGVQVEWLMLECTTAAYWGKLRRARELSRGAAIESAAGRAGPDQKETAALFKADAALREALFGNSTEARVQARGALGLSTGALVHEKAALALAIVGETAQSQKLADDLAKRFPEDTIVRFKFAPAIRAQIALNNGDAAASIEALKSAVPYEMGTILNLFPAYMRGVAYLAARQGIEAAAEFQKILDHRGVVVNNPHGALAHLGLARAYAMQGDTTKARAAYQDFLTLWKDADPDIPIYKEAEAEYAKLQ